MKQSGAAPSSHHARIEYEPGLVEECVRQAIENGCSGIPGLRLGRLRLDHRRQLDAIYRMVVGEPREAAFREHFQKLFHEFDLDSWVPRWLEFFPGLGSGLECVLVRSPQMAGQQGAELWETREQRGQGIPAYLIITLSPLELGRNDELQTWLLPELQIAADMLDPGFGFRREHLKRGTRAERERLGAAYHRLWTLSARGRLQARGLLAEASLGDELDAFSARELLAPPDGGTLHEQLLRLTLRLAERAIAGSSDGVGRCPLCRFPTCDWASDDRLRQLQGAIRADLEDWTVGDGCCGQCAERYELLAPRLTAS